MLMCKFKEIDSLFKMTKGGFRGGLYGLYGCVDDNCKCNIFFKHHIELINLAYSIEFLQDHNLLEFLADYKPITAFSNCENIKGKSI